MEIDVIETSGLGDRSYLVSTAGAAVVIDPQRDIDRVLALAEKRAVRIALVLETHLPNDYLTGGLELAATVGADYVVPAGDSVAYERVPATDGDVLEAGPMRLRVLHTPGHTHHRVSYVLADADGGVQAVFTGGSMLHGATGRTDLVGPEHTDADPTACINPLQSRRGIWIDGAASAATAGALPETPDLTGRIPISREPQVRFAGYAPLRARRGPLPT